VTNPWSSLTPEGIWLKAHMKIALLSLLFLTTTIAAFAQGQSIMSVPMEEEPHHHVLLKNEFVEVIRAMIPPGESTLIHTHSHESAGFALVKSTSTEQFLGKTEGLPSTLQAGEVWAEPFPDQPYTHRIHNVGNSPVDVFGVECRHVALKPDCRCSRRRTFGSERQE
jgi:hypothetical protein